MSINFVPSSSCGVNGADVGG